MLKASKNSETYHFSAQPPKKDHSLLFACLIAISCHLLFIFGIRFTTGKTPEELAKDVATVLTQNTEENEEALFIANASQQGDGQLEEIKRQETSQTSPLVSDTEEQTQDIINQEKQQRQQQYQESYLRTTLSWKEVDAESDNDEEDNNNDLQEQEERIKRELATLEAQLSQNQQTLASNTKIETVDSNSTTYSKTSNYLNNFKRHVEGVANQYYPAQALAQNITGDVRLMVIIKSNGEVKAIRLLESSGSPILDEAAKQSVRQSAPYGKFTAEMNDIVELRIIRTWRYSGDITVDY